jgi:aminopeptidase N
MIWTLSQPFGARAWWPCKDVPSDKADSVDIKVTVPDSLIVASNGTLVRKETKENLTTYEWRERYPIVTYLVSLAIHPFTVYYDQYLYNHESEPMPIHFYLFEENYERLITLNAKTKNMIGHFAGLFGEYPFVKEKYGHADFLGGGAMEHQTCSSFSFWDEWVVAHELAHQWWVI